MTRVAAELGADVGQGRHARRLDVAHHRPLRPLGVLARRARHLPACGEDLGPYRRKAGPSSSILSTQT